MREKLHTRLLDFLSKQSSRRDVRSILSDVGLSMAKDIDKLDERIVALERIAAANEPSS